MVDKATGETKRGDAGSGAEGQAKEAQALSLSLKGRQTPIVVRVKKGKKKRKYSRDTKDLQRRLRTTTKGADVLVTALAAGLGAFRKRSEKSADKRRDGILKDLLRNSAVGLSKTLRKSSKVPRILAKSVKRSSVRRRLRGMKGILG